MSGGFDRLLDSVVRIDVRELNFDDGAKRIDASIGSGVILSKDGLVLTNAHVAGPKAVEINVTLSNLERVGAKLVWSVLADSGAASSGGADDDRDRGGEPGLSGDRGGDGRDRGGDGGAGEVRAEGADRSGTVLVPLPAELARTPCLSDDEVRYICQRATAIEEAEGTPQDVEWAVARDQDLPDSVYFLQHRPETTWSPASHDPPSPETSPEAASEPAKSFDPVQYALRNVFKVPGT